MAIPPIVAAAGQLDRGDPPAGAVRDHDHRHRGRRPHAGAGSAAIVLLGVVGTGVAYVLNYRIIADLGADPGVARHLPHPVVAVVVGVVVLDEPFEWRIVVGGALIIAGIAAVNSRRPAIRTAPTSVTQ